MTNTWSDIKNSNLVVITGGNAAEAHPCGFKWVTEAKHYNKAKLIVVDPRYTRSAAMADLYMPIRAGTDIAWLGGAINYLLSNDKIQRDYVLNYTNASFIVKDEFGFQDGLFTGYNAEKRDYDRSSWGTTSSVKGGFATNRSDAAEPALRLSADEGALFATRRRWWSASGTPRTSSPGMQWIAETAAPDKAMTSMYRPGLDSAFQRARRTSAPWRSSSSAPATSASPAAA